MTNKTTHLVLVMASALFNECEIIARCKSEKDAYEALQSWKKANPDYRGEAAIVEIRSLVSLDWEYPA